MLRPGRKTSPPNNGMAKSNNNGNGGLPLYHSSTNGNGSSTNVAGFPPRKRTSKAVLRSPASRRRICCNKYLFVFIASLVAGCVLFFRGDTNSGALPQGSTYAAPPLMTWDHDPSSSSKMASFFQRRRRASSEGTNNIDNNHNNFNKRILPPHPPHNGVYDIVVLGAGPAGLTAALFAARAGLSVLVAGSDAGALSETSQLENFPAYSSGEGGGAEWLLSTKRQAAQWGAQFAQAGLLVDQLQIDKSSDESQAPTFTLEIASSSKKQPKMAAVARSVVVATGATSRRLNLPLEDSLWGKSVHSCAVCDGSSYVDKTVVVVGGGDAAVDGALLLARYAKQVILVHRRTEFRASNQRNLDLLQHDSNKNIITLKTPYVVKQLETTTTQGEHNPHVLTGVQIQNVETQETEQIACDGVFELIGATPNTEWLKATTSSSDLKLDKEGFLTLASPTWDSTRATTVDGIFAAGEVTDNIYRQAITAAAEGAQAAMDAERWLRAHPATPALTNKANPPEEIPLQTVLVSGDSGEVPKPLTKKGGGQHLQQEEERVLDEQEDTTKEEDCNFWEEECVNKLINKYPVIMFSKERCPECKKALEIFTIEGLPPGHRNLHILDITTSGTSKSNKAREVLLAKTGSKSVPSIFINGKSIGGHDELVEFHRDGRLKALLTEAGAQEKTTKEGCNVWEEECINKIVNKYPVVMFSKDRCPECQKALEIFTIEGLPARHRNLHILDITALSKHNMAREVLLAMTGSKSVPSIFINGKSIGGHDELVEFHRDGRLKGLLTEAGAIDVEDCDLEQLYCIERIVHRYPVVVFSKPWCPYCRKALEALSIEGLPEGHINLHVIDLSTLGNKAKKIQNTLNTMTGRRTVPNVFVGGTSIGGGDETVQLAREGKLSALLNEVNALGGITNAEAAEAIEKEEIEESKAAVHQPDVANEPDGGGPCDISQEPCLKKLLSDYPVVMFTKQGCPHCTKALEALALDGLPEGSPSLHIVNLSDWPKMDMDNIQDILERWTDRRTVPNVFIGGANIGGGSETVQMQQSGELKKLLEKVHAIEPPQPQAQQQGQQGLQGQEQKLTEVKQQPDQAKEQVQGQHQNEVKPEDPVKQQAAQQQAQEEQVQAEPQEQANQQQQAQKEEAQQQQARQQHVQAEPQEQARQQQAQQQEVPAEQQEQATQQQQAQQQKVQAEPQVQAKQQQAQQQEVQAEQQDNSKQQQQAQQHQVQEGPQDQAKQQQAQQQQDKAEQQEKAKQQKQDQAEPQEHAKQEQKDKAETQDQAKQQQQNQEAAQEQRRVVEEQAEPAKREEESEEMANEEI